MADAMTPPQPSQNDQGDWVCEHGTAMDVHCCNCHSGFLFDADSCVCVSYDELVAALKAVCNTDDDCPMCDRGRLRNPKKTHWPECPFGQAEALIARIERPKAHD